jgi:DNA primase
MKSLKASQKYEEELGYLIGDDYNNLSMMILDLNHTYGKADVGKLIDMCTDQNIRDLITNIVSNEEYDVGYDEEKLSGAMRKIKIEVLADQANQYKQQLQSAMNGQSLTLLINKYNECLQEQRRLLNEENQRSNENKED